MAVRHTSNRNSDGNMFGQDASDKIGFHGTPPVVRQTLPNAPTAQQLADWMRLVGLINPAV